MEDFTMRLAALGFIGALGLVAAAASANAGPITPRPDADTLGDATQSSSITQAAYYERYGWRHHRYYGHRWRGYYGGYYPYYGGGYYRGYRYRNWYGY
jgi:hypothetical protein